VGLFVADVPWNQVISSDGRERLTATTQLELRKTGLRVVLLDSAGNAMAPYDALLLVGVIRISGQLLNVRLQVRQPARLERSNRAMWVTTWTWEDASFGQPDSLVMRGTNALLSKWLDMNGR
jgi:hypothetical protein